MSAPVNQTKGVLLQSLPILLNKYNKNSKRVGISPQDHKQDPCF